MMDDEDYTPVGMGEVVWCEGCETFVDSEEYRDSAGCCDQCERRCSHCDDFMRYDQVFKKVVCGDDQYSVTFEYMCMHCIEFQASEGNAPMQSIKSKYL